MTCQDQKVSRATLWTESTWSEITDHVAKRFRLTAEERDALHGTKIAQIIAAIPFVAGCDQPMRTSLANMAVYMMSVGPTKKVFNATPEDDTDIFARLELARFPGGDQRIIDRGMAMIALNMLSDYRRDAIFDIANSKHNPLATGAWDYESLEAALLKTIHDTDCPDLDAIATVPEVMNGTWSWNLFPDWF